MSDLQQDLTQKRQQHNRIFKKLEQELLGSTEPKVNPTIVILGGQPGAGKSFLEEQLQLTIFAGEKPAIIDSDKYREHHPDFKKIIAKDDKLIYEKTNDAVPEWTFGLLHSAVKNNRDIILQGTMRNTDVVLKTIGTIRKEHPQYKIHAVAVSVNPEISRASTMLRYYGQKQKVGHGRFVSTETHDEACKAIPQTLRAVEEQGLIDSVTIVDRHNKAIYHHEAVNGIYTKPQMDKDAQANLIIHQSRNGYTKEERNEAHQQLADTMQAVGADKKEITSVLGKIRGEIKEIARTEELTNTQKSKKFVESEMPGRIMRDPILENSRHIGTIEAFDKAQIIQSVSSKSVMCHNTDLIEGIEKMNLNIGDKVCIKYSNSKATIQQLENEKDKGISR